MQTTTEYSRHTMARMLICLMIALQACQALAADATYVCPMRGRPCPTTVYPAAGKCRTCGMALITQAEYDALNSKKKHIGIVLYTAFELLDVAGPMEMWGNVPDFDLITVAEKAGPVSSLQNATLTAAYSFADAPKLDIIMVPGGMGTLTELANEKMLAFLRERSAQAEIVTSVCSGSALLAKAGVLDGHKATSNKLYFGLAKAQSDKVEWIPRARWVDDGKFITSSGVSAGMDMALHLIARLYTQADAEKMAKVTEYIWHSNPDDDPFAIAEK